MNKLLSANFIRLKKNKVFWFSLVFMLAAGILFPVMRYVDMKQTGSIHQIEHGFWGCTLFIGVIMAVFCSLFLGTEYSDGTIRNKVIVGHNRNAIYLANFVACAVVGLVMCITFFVPYLCLGIPLLGFFHMDAKMVVLFVLAAFFLSLAFSSVYTLISMLSHNRTITAVVCILLSFGLLLTGAMLNKMLEAPETIPSYTMGENGETAMEEMPNPKYLDGTKREVIQFLYDFIPGGQAIQCASLETVNLPLLPLYSFIIILSATCVGPLCFRKKDIK